MGVAPSAVARRSSIQQDVPRHPSITIENTGTDTDLQQQEEGKNDETRCLMEEPVTQTFLGKIQAFERMDLLARTQRIHELQEARKARVSYIYIYGN